MERDYIVPENFEDYVYVSQLLQAQGIKTAIEAHRRAKPYCMGTLYWQFNDCWPVTSWSGIDYYGRWKAMQYTVKNSYKTYLISFEEKDQNLSIYVVSDSMAKINANLTWKIMDFNGNLMLDGQEDIFLEKNSSEMYANIGLDQFAEIRSDMVLIAELWSENTLLNSAKHYFIKPAHLALSYTNIQIEILEKSKKYAIELTSETLAKDVCLISTSEGFFSDNYFDLMPGEKRIIYFIPGQADDQIPQFEIKCLNNLY